MGTHVHCALLATTEKNEEHLHEKVQYTVYASRRNKVEDGVKSLFIV